MIVLYNTMVAVGLAIYLPLLMPILLLSKKRRKTVLQRLGFTLQSHEKRRKGEEGKNPIWIHALSVGEVISAEPLVRRCHDRCNDRPIVFSSSTLTGFNTASALLRPHVNQVFYFPYDLPFSVKWVVRKISPGFVVIVESDLWPNFMQELNRRQIKAVFVNARISKRSFSGYKRLGSIMRPVFSSFAAVCAQSKEDRNRLLLLGVPEKNIVITGNLKFDQNVDSVPKETIDLLKQRLKIQSFQSILLAGSTHAGEELILLDAFAKLKQHFPELVLIIAPRNVERAGAVLKLASSKGFSCYLSEKLSGKIELSGPDVIVVEVMGVLKKLYALADIAFIGGSLVNKGGHNPLEAAAYAKPILFGECMSDFKEISQMLVSSGGAQVVRDSDNIYDAVNKFLNDKRKAQKAGALAEVVFAENKGAVNKTLSVIERLLPKE